MLKYVKVETEELEVYEKVVVAYSNEQAIREFLKWNDIDISDCCIQVNTYKLNDFVSKRDYAVVHSRLTKMEFTIEGLADFKDVYDEWHNAIELFTKLCITLEDEWEDFSVEEKVIRFANIEHLYNHIMIGLLNE